MKSDSVNSLMMTMRAELSRLTHPLQRMFLAKKSGAGSKTWQEQAIVNGAAATFSGGRVCAADTDGNALIDDSNVFGVLEVRDGDQMRYVKIGAGGSPVKDLYLSAVYPSDTSPAGHGLYFANTLNPVDPLTITDLIQLTALTLAGPAATAVFINLIEQTYPQNTLALPQRVQGYLWGTFCGYPVYVGNVVQPKYDCVWAV